MLTKYQINQHKSPKLIFFYSYLNSLCYFSKFPLCRGCVYDIRRSNSAGIAALPDFCYA